MIHHNIKPFVMTMLFFFAVCTVAAQDEQQITTKDEWKKAMDEAALKKEQLQNAIRELEREVAEMTVKDSMLAVQLQKENAELTAMLNAAEARRKEYEDLLNRVDAALGSMNKLSKSQIAGSRSELDSIAQMIEQERADRLAEREEYKNRLASQQAQLDRLRASIQGVRSDVVVVGTWERDRACLWNIAKKASVYDDPSLWVKLWMANKKQISNPDIIKPGQELRVPAKAPLTKNELAALQQYHEERSIQSSRSFAQSQR